MSTRFCFNETGKLRYTIITERFLTSVLKILGSDTEIPKRTINNLIRLFNSVDLRYYYDRDVTVGTLIKVIEMIIGNRLINHNIADVDNYILGIENLLYNETNAECITNVIIPTLSIAKNNKYPYDLEILNSGLDTQLKYGKILMMADDLTQTFNNVRTTTGSDLVEALTSLRSLFSTALEFFRETDIQEGIGRILHTCDPEFIDSMTETFEKLKNPSNVLRTGLQMLNRILSTRGGFECGKSYVIYARINSFKSALLEQITRMIQTYNSEFFEEEFRRTGRRPTILNISLENSIHEDNERYFKMYTEEDMELIKTVEVMRQIWAEYYNKTNSIIDISMYHGESGSLRPSDIRNMIDSLNDEGYRVIAVVLDYFELIRAEDEYMKLDLRNQYTKNSEALLEIAKFYDIPVITAHQVNRAGDAVMMNAKESGGTNLVTQMSSQYIGESYGIEKFVSHSIFINVEKSPYDNKVYLTVKSHKNRNKKDSLEYFVHEIKHGIYLEDDIYLPEPLSKLAIVPEEIQDLAFHVVDNDNIGARGTKDPTREEYRKIKKQQELLNQNINNKGDDILDKIADGLDLFANIANIFTEGFNEAGYTNYVYKGFNQVYDEYVLNDYLYKKIS